MVHMKTILTIAIIFIIQANGNEVVLRGHGADGSFNEVRKQEESLPGGGSSVMITRRMFGAPIKALKTFKSTLGVPSFLSGLRSSLNLNNQLGLTAPSGFAPQPSQINRWSSFAPWSHIQQQPSSSSLWNLPSQDSSNTNLATLGLPNNAQWNLGANSQFGLNPQIQSGSSQWLSPSTQTQFNPSAQSPFVSQWGSSVPSILGSNSNLYQHPQINDNYNPNPSFSYNPMLSGPSAPDTGIQQSISQFQTNGNAVPGLILNSLQNHYMNGAGGDLQQQQIQDSGFHADLRPGFTNYLQGSPVVQGQHGIEQILNQIPSQGPSAGSMWGYGQQVPIQGYQQFLSNPQTLSHAPSAWAKSEASSSLGKRSADEVEEDNAEEEWLKK